ncbi:AraC family transcriptional regulator [Sphingobium sp.]|uniref:AraC family transcriptional regulator n=1 Tax=Sphingobium sp. TaxID=1912891 RepID=UPI0028BE5D11|nr:AraC family transcriptional regulator [Sphingobium sp.]
MPDELCKVAKQWRADFPGGRKERYACRLSWLADWYFVRSTSQGVDIRWEFGARPPSDYAVLVLSFGRSISAMNSASIGKPGTIGLLRFIDCSDFRPPSEFDYLIAHVPRTALETELGEPAPYGCAIPAYRGAGAVLASSLRALADCSLRDETDQSLRSLLPEYARLIQTTMMRVQSDCVSDITSEQMETVRDYLQQHLSDPALTSEQVAVGCGMSRRQLYRHFEGTGQGFAEMLRMLRLDRAAFELRDSPRLSIAEVAYRCGFENPVSFSRSFKAQFGCSPRDMRG